MGGPREPRASSPCQAGATTILNSLREDMSTCMVETTCPPTPLTEDGVHVPLWHCE